MLLWFFGAIGSAGNVLGLFALFALTASIVRPIDRAIHHFERIAAGYLTSPIDTARQLYRSNTPRRDLPRNCRSNA